MLTKPLCNLARCRRCKQSGFASNYDHFERTSARYSPEVMPIHRLKARVKALAYEKPLVRGGEVAVGLCCESGRRAEVQLPYCGADIWDGALTESGGLIEAGPVSVSIAASISPPLNPIFLSDRDTAFSFNLGEGVSLTLSRNIEVDVGCRSFSDSGFEHTDCSTPASPVPAQAEFETHSVAVSLRAHF